MTQRTQKTHLIIALGISGFFLLADRLFKHIAYTHPDASYYLIKPWLGWEYLGNTGIAFSLPLAQNIVLAITPLVLFGLFVLYRSQRTKTRYTRIAILFLFFGSVSNYIDRILYGVTIDYVRVITSVINVADVMIIFGASVLLMAHAKGETGRHKKAS